MNTAFTHSIKPAQANVLLALADTLYSLDDPTYDPKAPYAVKDGEPLTPFQMAALGTRQLDRRDAMSYTPFPVINQSDDCWDTLLGKAIGFNASINSSAFWYMFGTLEEIGGQTVSRMEDDLTPEAVADRISEVLASVEIAK